MISPGHRPPAGSGTFALFRVAAGPHIGHGHLRRAEALAAALGRSVGVSIRGAGGAPTRLPVVASASPGETLDDVRPIVLIVDDPHAGHGCAWVRAATRRRVPVVSLHDLGLARVPSSLAIDGSVTGPARGWPAARTLRGLPFAVIRPPRLARPTAVVGRILVSLGGGARTRLSHAVAAEITRRHEDVQVLVTDRAGASVAGHARGVHAVLADDGLAAWLARVDVAVVGGGVSLYEAIAAGVPSAALAVVSGQQPTIRAFARRHLTLSAGSGRGRLQVVAMRVADRVERLVHDEALRRTMHERGPRAVDGQGARRVAEAIVAVTEEARRD